MVEFPKIPTRLIFSGDKEKGKRLIGLGRKRFSDLTTALGFQGLEHGFNTLEMSDGSTIKTSQSYGVSKIEIYIPIIISEPIEIEKEEEEVEAVFFYNIVNDGNIDDQVGGTIYVPELVTNRIIIWNIALYSDLTLKGEGEVLFDVDLESETVYFPEDLTSEEMQAAIDTVTSYQEVIAPNIEPEDREPKDMLSSWFVEGSMSNPFTCYESCGNTEDRSSVLLSVDESWTGINSNEWWQMIEGPSEYPASTAWKEAWCPSEGGDQNQLYTGNIWPLLSDNAENYLEYAYAANYYPPDSYSLVVRDISDCPYTAYKNGLFMLGWQWDLITSWPDAGEVMHLGVGIKSGNFYTGVSEYQFPCFFSIENEDYNFGIFYFSFNSYDSGDNPTGDCAEQVNIDFSLASENPKRETISISTPLEIINVSEYAISHTPICSESNCFELSNDLNIVINGGGGFLSSEYKPYLPCNVSTAKLINKESEVYDDDFFSQVSIVDEAETTLNLFGLLIQEEQNAKVRAYFREESDSHYYCNGTDYGTSVSGVPYTYPWHIGTIIYIISPEEWWTEEDGIKSGFWDIHSERISEDEINPNRCLVLEEYINGALDEIKEVTKTLSATPKKDSTGIYTLETYNHSFYSGFTYKL